jgi:hypothetical protein
MISIKQIFMASAFLCSAFVTAQVGIGTTTPNASAVLDVSSTTSGLLPPRMTNAQKLAIPSPVAGLLVWCSNCGSNGEMQVFNSLTWTNMSGSAPSGQVPTITSTTAAVVPTTGVSAGVSAVSGGVVSDAGSATITERGICYSTTQFPTILNTKVVVAGTTGTFTGNITGLPAGTTYYVRAFATTSAGTGYGNQVSFQNCGAWISQWTYKLFMCHNLGADTTLDPNVPVQGIQGDYYQWGSSTPVATAYTSSAAISGWNTTPNADGSWLDINVDLVKGPNDPCPAGYAIAGQYDMNGLISSTFNTITRTGATPWINDPNNYGVAIHYGPSASVKTLTLPVAGYRLAIDGSLGARAVQGIYWRGYKNGANAFSTQILDASIITATFTRPNAMSIRCVKM